MVAGSLMFGVLLVPATGSAGASGTSRRTRLAAPVARAASRESRGRSGGSKHARCASTHAHRRGARGRSAAGLRGCRARRPAADTVRRGRAATIAVVLATPCQNTDLMPSPANLELVRAAVLCLINRDRADSGDMPLKVNRDLQRSAELHTAEMLSEDYFEHVSPSGSTPVDRDSTSGYIPSPYVGYVIGENLAWGTLSLASPEAIVAAWMASPGHRANILEGSYRETGVAVGDAAPAALAEGSPGATYTQEFGVIIG